MVTSREMLSDREEDEVPILTFDGAGPSAVAYAGALVELESRMPAAFSQIKQTGGASSGAIIAMLLSLGYSTQEISGFAFNTNFKALLQSKGLGDEAKRLLHMEGLFDHGQLRKDLEQLVARKMKNPAATFADFHQAGMKELRVIATQLRRKEGSGSFESFIFSYETAKNTAVVDAVLASTAVPGIFPPVRLKDFGNGCYKQDRAGHLFIDGGISSTVLPITLYDEPRPPQPELGDDKPVPMCSPVEYTKILLEAVEAEHWRKFSSAKVNMRTRGFQINSAAEIKQYQAGKLFVDDNVFLHPLQAISDKANKFIFGPRIQHFFQAFGMSRSYLIPRPADVTKVDFNETQAQKEELFKAGQKTVAEEYASKKVSVIGFFSQARTKLEPSIEGEKTNCPRGCVIL